MTYLLRVIGLGLLCLSFSAFAENTDVIRKGEEKLHTIDDETKEEMKQNSKAWFEEKCIKRCLKKGKYDTEDACRAFCQKHMEDMHDKTMDKKEMREKEME